MLWRLSRNYGNDEGGGAGTEGIVFQRGNKHRHDSPLFHYTTLPFVIMEKIHISFVICYYKVEMPYFVSHYFLHRKLRIVIYDTILINAHKYRTLQFRAFHRVYSGVCHGCIVPKWFRWSLLMLTSLSQQPSSCHRSFP